MANTAQPFGLRQYGQREGSAPTAGFETLTMNASDTSPVFTGDLVFYSSGGAGANGVVTQFTSGGGLPGQGGLQPAVGVFMGCKYYNASVQRTVWNSYWPGNLSAVSSTNGFVQAFVCTNPQQLYLIQGTSGAVMGSTMIGYNVSITTSNSSLGNTTTGVSAITIQSSLGITATTSNGPLRVIDFYGNVAPPGVNGTSTGSEGLQIMVVQPNFFARNTTTAVAT